MSAKIIKFIRNTRVEEIKDTSYFINLPIELIDLIVKKELDLNGLIDDKAFLSYNYIIKRVFLDSIALSNNMRYNYAYILLSNASFNPIGRLGSLNLGGKFKELNKKRIVASLIYADLEEKEEEDRKFNEWANSTPIRTHIKNIYKDFLTIEKYEENYRLTNEPFFNIPNIPYLSDTDFFIILEYFFKIWVSNYDIINDREKIIDISERINAILADEYGSDDAFNEYSSYYLNNYDIINIYEKNENLKYKEFLKKDIDYAIKKENLRPLRFNIVYN